MKNISTYISEKLKISSSKSIHNYTPDNREKLTDLIGDLIEQRGYDADLNDIDVSKINDMYGLFYLINTNITNIDISEWDVSKVENTVYMFNGCTNFNSDLSRWNVSKVKNMSSMFAHCYKFNSDLSEWDVSNVTNMSYMFCKCKNFNQDISEWNIYNVEDMTEMFYGCKKLNQDLSKWKLYKNRVKVRTNNMITGCTSLKSTPCTKIIS